MEDEIVVFWLDVEARYEKLISIIDALKLMESLRKRGIEHVSVSSKIIGDMTKKGVEDVVGNYNWKKRR